MHNRPRVVVTGLGAVSTFGLGVEAFWDGLTSTHSGKAEIRQFQTRYRSSLAAELPAGLLDRGELIASAGHPQEEATLLATLSAAEALANAGLDGADKREFGCVVGTLCSGSRVFERYCQLYCDGEADLAAYPDVDSSTVYYQLEHVIRHFGMEGPSTLVSTACSSSTDAIGYAADMIRSGAAQVMLAGGADILAEMVHAGFNAVFSITKDHSRPFDTGRSGFFIGEGAGMLVLESYEHAMHRGATVYAEVLGYGLSNAAYHLTATSDDGVGEAMAITRCLSDAGVRVDQVDYVNAHGTATQHNDTTEIEALRLVFGEWIDKVAVTSIKANIGHCMGASGALEAVATVKCMQKGYIPPTLNSTGDLDPSIKLVVGNGVVRPLRYAISQSFGFGGASSAVLFGASDQPQAMHAVA